MSTPLSDPPDPSKPDRYRTEFKTLADRNDLRFQCVEENALPGPCWWATYYLLNTDGSIANYLGSSLGTSKSIAKEHSAKIALGSLTSLISTGTLKAEPAMELDTYLPPNEGEKGDLTVGYEQSLNRLVSGSLQGTEAAQEPMNTWPTRTQTPGSVSNDPTSVNPCLQVADERPLLVSTHVSKLKTCLQPHT